MKKIFSLQLLLVTGVYFAQTPPVSLRPDIKVKHIMDVKEKCSRMAKDPVSGNLFYITSVGKVYEIKNINTKPHDSLLYTEADHGIAYLQGMTFIDSSLFVIGNKMIDSTITHGLIKKAVLQPDGKRKWVDVMTTAPYPQSYTWYDHGFSGLVASMDKNYLLFTSGSRTDHGEIQTNKGLYPGLREVPLTSALFRIPANSENLTLPNDETGLIPYLYADGLRNTFDLAFNSDGELFGTENSGDRDDPDEMNWIRQGKHYGFPWIMGGNDNPQQFPGYDKNKDPLLNVQSHCYIQGYYGDDPTFPPKGSQAFVPSLVNIGPDGDNYREISGYVKDGSITGKFLGSFTPHRSPLGLSFDRNRILDNEFVGDGFAVSYTRGGDSTGLDQYGYPGTIVDHGQDLLHIKLIPHSEEGYRISTTTLIKDFSNPVDTELDGNNLYVIEYNDSGTGRLLRVTLPASPTYIADNTSSPEVAIYPNPGNGKFTVEVQHISDAASVCVYDALGKCVLDSSPLKSLKPDCTSEFCIDLRGQAKGVYLLQIKSDEQQITKKLVVE